LLRLAFRYPQATVSSAAGPISWRQTTLGTDRATPDLRTTKLVRVAKSNHTGTAGKNHARCACWTGEAPVPT